MAGIDEAVILSQQLFARILGDGAELVVHVRDGSLWIGNGNNGVFVQGGLQVADFLERVFQLPAGLAALQILAIQQMRGGPDQHCEQPDTR